MNKRRCESPSQVDTQRHGAPALKRRASGSTRVLPNVSPEGLWIHSELDDLESDVADERLRKLVAKRLNLADSTTDAQSSDSEDLEHGRPGPTQARETRRTAKNSRTWQRFR